MPNVLVHGQNMPLEGTRVRVEIEAACPVEVLGVLTGADAGVARRGGPAVPGVAVGANTVVADLGTLPAATERLVVAMALPEGGAVASFGAVRPPRAAVRVGDDRAATFDLTALGTERAVHVVEFYRRQGAWKLRAVGQGYEAGLGALLADLGVSLPAVVPAAPAAPDDPAEQYRHVWAVFEDAARSSASYRSAVDYAQDRFDREVQDVLADPAARMSGAGRAAQDAARERRADLVARAQEALDRDTAQLVAELDALEAAFPAALAPWDSPAWALWQAPADIAHAIRIGELHVPERPDLRVPLLLRLPAARALWIDSAEDRPGAVALAASLTARLLAAHPPGALRVHVLDPAAGGAAAATYAPLAGSGLLSPAAADEAAVRNDLAALVEHAELVRTALENGMTDDLPPGSATGRLVVAHDFPVGYDDRSVTMLRHLVEEGPEVGVHVTLVADRADAGGYGPLLDSLWRTALRLTPQPDEHVADPWVGLAWTYTPDVPPGGDDATRTLLGWVASA